MLGVGLGTVAISPADTVAILAERLLGIRVDRAWSAATETIVLDLRLPRVLTAMVVGAGLAVAGATFQGLLRNPLADPYVLGTASGAALGAAIAVLIPVRLTFLEFGLLHGLAFVGALAAVFTVYRLSRIGGLSPLTSLLLTGYAVGSLLAAGLAMAMYLSGAALRQIFSYLLGGFDASSWSQLAGAVPLVAIGSVFDPPPGARAQRPPARRGGGRPPRRRRPAGAGDPPRPRLARDRGRRRGQRADRLRRARRAARRPARRRPERPRSSCRSRRSAGRASSRSPTSPRGSSARSRSGS